MCSSQQDEISLWKLAFIAEIHYKAYTRTVKSKMNNWVSDMTMIIGHHKSLIEITLYWNLKSYDCFVVSIIVGFLVSET